MKGTILVFAIALLLISAGFATAEESYDSVSTNSEAADSYQNDNEEQTSSENGDIEEGNNDEQNQNEQTQDKHNDQQTQNENSQNNNDDFYSDNTEVDDKYYEKPSNTGSGFAADCELSPSSLTIPTNQQQEFVAICYDETGDIVDCPQMSWTSTIGSLTYVSTSTALFSSGSEPGMNALKWIGLQQLAAYSPNHHQQLCFPQDQALEQAQLQHRETTLAEKYSLALLQLK